MKIAVYLGSVHGNDPVYDRTASELGTWIGKSANTLVYGGAGIGTMAVLADHVLAEGGTVIGVMPRFMVDAGRSHAGLSEMHLTDTMSERKAMMIDLADAFIALPGGPGTIEEITEVISLIRLHRKQGRCALLSLDGYYDGLLHQYQQMIAAGFYTAAEFSAIRFAESLGEAEQFLADGR